MTTIDGEFSRLKLIKISCIMSSLVTLAYTIFYWLSLNRSDVSMLNMLFIITYLVPLVLIKQQMIKAAALTLLAVVMSHLFIYSYFIFSADAGFHFYYFLVPTVTFLLFEDEKQWPKITFTLLGLVLFFICQTSQNTPFVIVPDYVNQYFFISSILVITVEVYVVLYVYTNTINHQTEALKVMASIDPLTAVNNRHVFESVGENLFLNAQRYGRSFSVLLIDIDWFKKINDNYGHLVGDITLKNIAQLLKNNIRNADIIARYGGEEFIILLPELSKSEAETLANKLRNKVANCIIQQDDISFNCTVSIGVAEYRKSSSTFTDIIDEADKALYVAKDQGRNCVVCA